jgi:tetratricopeptide (TPR) repeat protein
MQAQILMARQQWEEAKAPLTKLMAAYPENVGRNNPYRLLAEVHRNLGEREQEIEMLTQLAARSADATDAYSRLMEVGTEREEWQQVVENGQRYMAVYPMLATVHERIGRASEALGRDEEAVAAYRRLLRLESGDPVDVNYRLARLLQEADPQAARRHILEALADAPRFRDGHRLLLEIAGEN